MKLTILGGSSPYTVHLIDLLYANVDVLPKYNLVLYGRNSKSLSLIKEYASYRLSKHHWKVETTTSIVDALNSSSIVIHQLRYRGLQGREEDEIVSLEVGLQADETLGASGLNSAIMTNTHLTNMAELMLKHCSDAWIINLTNPLCYATTLFIQQGLKNCVGLCELPYYTFLTACKLLKVNPEQVEWSYHGLNHRGLITKMDYSGENLIRKLATLLKETTQTIGGITHEDIMQFGAIPLKYYKIFNPKVNTPTSSTRAEFLSDLREEILSELNTTIKITPPSLKKRYMEWYPLSVLPFLVSINNTRPSKQIVNLINTKGNLVKEYMANISMSEIKKQESHKTYNSKIEEWLQTLEQHELALHRAAQNPIQNLISETLELDPAIPNHLIPKITQRILENVKRQKKLTKEGLLL